MAVMILGFTVILCPEKYVSGSGTAEELEKKFANETASEVSAAFNTSEIEDIKSGNISSNENFHYHERLKERQDEGVEGIDRVYCNTLCFHVLIYC